MTFSEDASSEATRDSNVDRAPSFPTLENEIDGVVANARISFALTTARRTASRGEWPQAIAALEKLADKLSTYDAPRSAWRELMAAAAFWAVRASNVDLIGALFETYAARAWSGESRQAMPFELAEALEEADRRGRYDAGRDLGELVETLYPTCPLGSFAVAHFRERALHVHGRDQKIGQVAASFSRAATLADALEMPRTAERARLRQGTLLLRSGKSVEQGRALLRDVDPSALSRSEALWYAVGMAHSPFWLDRVRAADAVIAVADTDAKPDTEPARDTLDATGYLIDCAPIELQPLEVDRLEGLADELGVEARKLGLRAHLESVASAEVTRAGEAADILAQSLGEDASDEQRASLAFTRAVASLLDATQDEGLDRGVLARIETSYPTAAHVLQALAATVANDARRLATSLGELEGHFRKHRHRLDRDALKPVGLLWPRLLPLVRDLVDDSDLDQTTRRRVIDSSKEIASRWIPNAPTPGYGWWSLAANLLACDMHEQAQAATRRAIDDGESVDSKLEARVIAAVLDHAVRDGSPDEMLDWLELAETRLA